VARDGGVVEIRQPGQQRRCAYRSAQKHRLQIDVWVNNALTTVFSPFREITPEEFRRATEVTYMGVVHGTMAALKRMTARNATSAGVAAPAMRRHAIC
jgi:NAD(P)-dependent dehydrogenase (short-subunit alcohol dehydrogenase family)